MTSHGTSPGTRRASTRPHPGPEWTYPSRDLLLSRRPALSKSAGEPHNMRPCCSLTRGRRQSDSPTRLSAPGCKDPYHPGSGLSPPCPMHPPHHSRRLKCTIGALWWPDVAPEQSSRPQEQYKWNGYPLDAVPFTSSISIHETALQPIPHSGLLHIFVITTSPRNQPINCAPQWRYPSF